MDPVLLVILFVLASPVLVWFMGDEEAIKTYCVVLALVIVGGGFVWLCGTMVLDRLVFGMFR